MTMLVRFAMAVCVLGGVAGAQSVHKRPMTFADLQAMKRVSDPQISPSGKWVMFSVTDVSLEKNSKVNHLWVVPLAGGAEKQITSGAGESNGRFSPDGRFVSFTNTTDGPSRIAIAPWDEKNGTVGSAHMMTAVSGDADGAIWSPDSHHLLLTTAVYPECSDKPKWADEDACNKAKDEAAAKNPVKAQVFDHLLYRHWNAFTGEKRSHVILIDFLTGGPNPRDLTPRSAVGDAETPTFSLGGPLGYAWAPDSKEIAYVTNLDAVKATSTNNDVFTLRVDEAGAVAKKVSTAAGSDDGPQYSPDGKWLAWRSQARNGFESDKFRLMVMDRTSGAIKDLMPKFDNWVDEFVWGPKSNSIYFAAPQAGTEQIYEFSLTDRTLSIRTEGVRGEETDDDIDLARDQNHSQGAEFGSLTVSSDGHWVAATMMTLRAPSDVITLQSEDREEYDDTSTPIVRRSFDGPATVRRVIFEERRLTHLNDALLTQLELPRMEEFTFGGAAKTWVEGFILRPPNFDPAKKYPVKFLMHGGPQTAWGDSWSYRWNWELLAADGYVVIGVNRRGSTGYGQKFVDEVSGDWGGKAFVDLMKGLDYAEAKYSFIDKNRECALGASYGGFMANWVLTHTDRFKCIVTHDGLYNAESAFGSTEELWFNEWEFRPLQAAPVGKADSSAALRNDNQRVANGEVEQTRPAYPWDYFDKPTAENPFRKNSPMLYIKNAHTPTLVVHSQRDYRLDVSEGFQLFTALQLLHVPSKMLYFPDEGHWVLKPQNSQLWYETVDDWCDRWLGMGKYAGVGPAVNPMSKGPGPRAQGPEGAKAVAHPKSGK